MNLGVKIYNLTGVGTEISNFNVSDTYEKYLINGSAIAIGNYAVSLTGTPQTGTSFIIEYSGTLNLGSNTFTILGKNFTAEQLLKRWIAEFTWNGSGWNLILQMNFEESGIISSYNLGSGVVQNSNIANNSIDGCTKLSNLSVCTSKIADLNITTPKLDNLSVTDVKIANDAVITTKILDLNVTTNKLNNLAVTTNKLDNLSVTTAKIVDNSVTTSKILDANVTNSKLVGVASSVKIGNNLGVVQDLVLGTNEIPIGNGTSVVATNINTLIQNEPITITLPISFEAGEQTTTKTVWYVSSNQYYLSSVYISVIKDIAATDDAIITVNFDTQPNILFDSPNPGSNIIIPANTLKGNGMLFTSTFMYPQRTNTFAFGRALNLTASKVTPGGKVIASVVLHKI